MIQVLLQEVWLMEPLHFGTQPKFLMVILLLRILELERGVFQPLRFMVVPQSVLLSSTLIRKIYLPVVELRS